VSFTATTLCVASQQVFIVVVVVCFVIDSETESKDLGKWERASELVVAFRESKHLEKYRYTNLLNERDEMMTT